jgi:putative transposase
MPLLAPDPVTVLPEQREALEHLIRTHATPQQLALRARIIVQAADGMGVRASARELGIWPKTVRYWRKRWRKAAEGQSVPERLADVQRSGAPATFTPEQICALVAMTCEKPSESERPISHWSQREIADEAMRRGLIPSISQRSVGRFLKLHRAIVWVILADFDQLSAAVVVAVGMWATPLRCPPCPQRCWTLAGDRPAKHGPACRSSWCRSRSNEVGRRRR